MKTIVDSEQAASACQEGLGELPIHRKPVEKCGDRVINSGDKNTYFSIS